MTTTTTTRTTTTTTRTRTRTRRRTRSSNNNDNNNDNDDDDNDDDDNEDAARSMSCPQVQMKSPSLFPSPDPLQASPVCEALQYIYIYIMGMFLRNAMIWTVLESWWIWVTVAGPTFGQIRFSLCTAVRDGECPVTLSEWFVHRSQVDGDGWFSDFSNCVQQIIRTVVDQEFGLDMTWQRLGTKWSPTLKWTVSNRFKAQMCFQTQLQTGTTWVIKCPHWTSPNH